MFAVYEGIVSPSTYPVQKLKKAVAEFFWRDIFMKIQAKKSQNLEKKF